MDHSSERPLVPPAHRSSDDLVDVAPIPPPGREVTWRALDHHLWVGRSGDSHVGIIEQGHRFTFTDAHEGVHRGFASLGAAQDAATGPIPAQPALRAHPSADRRGRGPRGLLSTPSLAMVALALGALALVSFLLLVV